MVRIILEDAFQRYGLAPADFSAEEKQRFLALRDRLLGGEPLQYVLGQADFFGLKFTVNPAVLIPRQETEELVAWVLAFLKERAILQPSVLDIGLGSGCIAVTLKHRQKDIRITGLETSPEALAVARGNALRLLENEDFSFLSGNALEAQTWSSLPTFDVMVSNPPYIPVSEQHLVPAHVLAHEPGLALFVHDDDPLVFYRVLAERAIDHLNPGGALFFECNEFNAQDVCRMLARMAFASVTLRQDISGADRMILALRP